MAAVVINIKGVRIGEGRPKTIVSLMATEPDEAARELDRLTPPAGPLGVPDCLEWRADFHADISDPEAIAHNCRAYREVLEHQPLIFTCRTAGQGGNAALTTDEYARVVRAVIERGRPDIVDLELSAGDGLVRDLTTLAHAHGQHVIVSHHDFEGTPDTTWMADCLVHMAELGADIPKLAVMAHTDDDATRLMKATKAAAERTGLPMIGLAMGERGSVTRVSGESFGSAMTFCAFGEAASAPGQVNLPDAVRMMDELHARLAENERP